MSLLWIWQEVYPTSFLIKFCCHPVFKFPITSFTCVYCPLTLLWLINGRSILLSFLGNTLCSVIHSWASVSTSYFHFSFLLLILSTFAATSCTSLKKPGSVNLCKGRSFDKMLLEPMLMLLFRSRWVEGSFSRGSHTALFIAALNCVLLVSRESLPS